MARSPTDELQVLADPQLSPDDLPGVVGSPLWQNFAFYARYSSPGTELFVARVTTAGRTVGVAPIVRLVRRRATDMLRHPMRRWLGPIIGPIARKTTLLIDTAFLAYDDLSPFATAEGVDRTAVKQAIARFCKKQRKVDTVWISEPAADAAWAAKDGFIQFHTLPMVHVPLAGCDSLEAYAGTLSKKRRRNFRQERDAFAKAGATIETHVGPLGGTPVLLKELLACLAASEQHSQFAVPYNDVLTDPGAFAEQSQTALVAKVDGRVVGFMSFLQDGDRLMQCHGGLDYHRSHEVMAYHNLIYAAIDHGIRHGCRLLSMGPLNNETKRRAGGELRPIVSSLWNKNPVDALVAKAVFKKNFEVYRGELGSEQTAAQE